MTPVPERHHQQHLASQTNRTAIGLQVSPDERYRDPPK
jgi:hypothetical protein